MPVEHAEYIQEGLGTDVLKEAHLLINGKRLEEYGTPFASFERIANYWNIYLSHYGIEACITTKDVAMMMLLMKVARLQGPKYTRDSIEDIIGYAALYDELRKD